MAIKPTQLDAEEESALIEELSSNPKKGISFTVVTTTTNTWKSSGTPRRVTNLDCVVEDGTLRRIVCFDDKPSFKDISILIPGMTFTINDFYSPFEGKIVIQEHTVFNRASDDSCQPASVLPKSVQHKTPGLNLPTLYAEKINFSVVEGRFVVLYCEICAERRESTTCPECKLKTIQILTNCSLSLTDKKTFKTRVSLTLPLLGEFVGLPYPDLIRALWEKRLADIHAALDTQSQFRCLIWTETVRAREINVLRDVFEAPSMKKKKL